MEGAATGPPWTYECSTSSGVLRIYEHAPEAAEEIETALIRAYNKVVRGFPILRPGSPEALANDTTRTRATAEAATRSRSFDSQSLANAVAQFRQLYNAHDYSTIWYTRCGYGITVGAEKLPGSNWYWFNAYAALAGLHLAKSKGFPLDNYCGLADVATDYDDPEQVGATKEINRRYFGNGEQIDS